MFRNSSAAIAVVLSFCCSATAWADIPCQGPSGSNLGSYVAPIMFPPPAADWQLKIASGECIDHVYVGGNVGKGLGDGTGGSERPLHVPPNTYVVKVVGNYGPSDCDSPNASNVITIRFLKIFLSNNTSMEWGKFHPDYAPISFEPPSQGMYIGGICGRADTSGDTEKRLVYAIGVVWLSMPGFKMMKLPKHR